MAYLLVFAIALALFLAALSLYRYGNIQRQHPIVTLSVLTAWCFSFLIVFTIPLDVTSVSRCDCFPIKSPQSKRTKSISDCVPAMSPRAAGGEWRYDRTTQSKLIVASEQHCGTRTVREAMGHGPRVCVPEFVAYHLLDVAISHLDYYAIDAVVLEGGRFHYQRQTEVGPH